ncbi:MAG: hypothetical protein R2720_04475 [Candidatus Nanopelagicales bacterium]
MRDWHTYDYLYDGQPAAVEVERTGTYTVGPTGLSYQSWMLDDYDVRITGARNVGPSPARVTKHQDASAG